MKKLTWMNGEYIRNTPRDEYAAIFSERLREAGLLSDDFPQQTLEGIIDQMQVRTRLYNEIPGNCSYFFTDNYQFDEKAVNKRLRGEGVAELLLEIAKRFEALPVFDLESTNATLVELGERRGTGLGAMVHPVRVAVSGMAEGPGLFELLVLLGRETVCRRLTRVAGEIGAI